MLKIDSTITITAVLAISAIISPIIVAVINNNHQIKIKKLELNNELNKKTFEIYYNDKKQAYKELIKIASNYPSFADKHGIGITRLQEVISEARLCSSADANIKLISFYTLAVELKNSEDVQSHEEKYRNELSSLVTTLTNDLYMDTKQQKPFQAQKLKLNKLHTKSNSRSAFSLKRFLHR